MVTPGVMCDGWGLVRIIISSIVCLDISEIYDIYPTLVGENPPDMKMWILMENWGQGINLVPLLNSATHADHYTGKCNNIQRIFSPTSYFYFAYTKLGRSVVVTRGDGVGRGF